MGAVQIAPPGTPWPVRGEVQAAVSDDRRIDLARLRTHGGRHDLGSRPLTVHPAAAPDVRVCARWRHPHGTWWMVAAEEKQLTAIRRDGELRSRPWPLTSPCMAALDDGCSSAQLGYQRLAHGAQ